MVFRTKRTADGFIERCKARLVAKEFNQGGGVDYTNIFSPVVKPDTIQYVLALALALTLEWPHHVDINSAFLNGDLSEN